MGAVERRRERCIIPDSAPQTGGWTGSARIPLSFPEIGIAVGPKAPQALGYHCVSGTQNLECLLINYNTSWKSWKLLVMPSYEFIFNQ